MNLQQPPHHQMESTLNKCLNCHNSVHLLHKLVEPTDPTSTADFIAVLAYIFRLQQTDTEILLLKLLKINQFTFCKECTQLLSALCNIRKKFTDKTNPSSYLHNALLNKGKKPPSTPTNKASTTTTVPATLVKQVGENTNAGQSSVSSGASSSQVRNITKSVLRDKVSPRNSIEKQASDNSNVQPVHVVIDDELEIIGQTENTIHQKTPNSVVTPAVKQNIEIQKYGAPASVSKPSSEVSPSKSCLAPGKSSSLIRRETSKTERNASKFPYTLTQLVVQALHYSPTGMLNVKGIQHHIAKKYPDCTLNTKDEKVQAILRKDNYFSVQPKMQAGELIPFWQMNPLFERRLVDGAFLKQSEPTNPRTITSKLNSKSNISEPSFPERDNIVITPVVGNSSSIEKNITSKSTLTIVKLSEPGPTKTNISASGSMNGHPPPKIRRLSSQSTSFEGNQKTHELNSNQSQCGGSNNQDKSPRTVKNLREKERSQNLNDGIGDNTNLSFDSISSTEEVEIISSGDDLISSESNNEFATSNQKNKMNSHSLKAATFNTSEATQTKGSKWVKTDSTNSETQVRSSPKVNSKEPEYLEISSDDEPEVKEKDQTGVEFKMATTASSKSSLASKSNDILPKTSMTEEKDTFDLVSSDEEELMTGIERSSELIKKSVTVAEAEVRVPSSDSETVRNTKLADKAESCDNSICTPKTPEPPKISIRRDLFESSSPSIPGASAVPLPTSTMTPQNHSNLLVPDSPKEVRHLQAIINALLSKLQGKFDQLRGSLNKFQAKTSLINTNPLDESQIGPFYKEIRSLTISIAEVSKDVFILLDQAVIKIELITPQGVVYDSPFKTLSDINIKKLAVDSLSKYFKVALLAQEWMLLEDFKCFRIVLDIMRYKIVRLLRYIASTTNESTSTLNDSYFHNICSCLRFRESSEEIEPNSELLLTTEWTLAQVVHIWDQVKLYNYPIDVNIISIDHERTGIEGYQNQLNKMLGVVNKKRQQARSLTQQGT